MLLVYNLRCHATPVTSLCLINSKELVSGDDGGNIVHWDLGQRRPRHMWKAHESAVVELNSLIELKNIILRY
jgi:hypothetical protein